MNYGNIHQTWKVEENLYFPSLLHPILQWFDAASVHTDLTFAIKIGKIFLKLPAPPLHLKYLYTTVRKSMYVTGKRRRNY